MPVISKYKTAGSEKKATKRNSRKENGRASIRKSTSFWDKAAPAENTADANANKNQESIFN